jgi:ABC-2 type transport system permease protein
MKKMVSLLRCDFTNSRRDSILLYLTLSPLLLAVGISLFVPSTGGAGVTFAVGPNVPTERVRALEEYVTVETFETIESVRKRVAGRDDVPGFYKEGDRYVLVFEGTESGKMRSLAVAAASAATEAAAAESAAAGFPDRGLNVTHRQGGEKKTDVREVLTLMMVMLASLIGGMTVGFNIVEERSNLITNALAVTPIKIKTYLGAKAVFAGLLGLFVSVCSVVIIMGFRLPWGRLLLAVVLSTMMASLFGYTMGRFAENQISALGLMKILMPAYLTIPLVSIFVPTQIHWVFVIFPQYWLFSAFQSLLAPGLAVLAGFWISLTVFVIETALLLTVVGRSMGKVFILRSRGAHG